MRTALLLAALLSLGSALAQPADAVQVDEGRLPSGAVYRFERPAQWQRGPLLVYSSGYSAKLGPPRTSHGDERAALLAQGYALMGITASRPGWALEQVVPEQLEALDQFVKQHGQPQRTIAIGTSMGALVSTQLVEQHPKRFDGGLLICGSVAGTLAMMNQAFDATWAFATLQPELGLAARLNASGDAGRQQRQAWMQAIATARETPLGRARLALVATLAQAPAWADAKRPPPALNDIDAQAAALAQAFAPASLLPRDDQEQRASGNFSWNEGVDYAELVRRSSREPLLRALYQRAGRSLDDDLTQLAAAPRTAADPAAVAYMQRHYVPTAEPTKPLLTLQTTADPLTLTEFSAAYAEAATAAGQGEQVRTAHVQRLGHCGFEPGEVLAALQTLEARIAGQPWQADAAALNNRARSSGVASPAFVDHHPAPLLRPCWNQRGSNRCTAPTRKPSP